MISGTSTYVYADADGQHAIAGSQIGYLGNWSALTDYLEGQGIDYAGAAYLAIADSTGIAPATHPETWAYLIKMSTNCSGTVSDSGSDGYARTVAEAAMQEALDVGAAVVILAGSIDGSLTVINGEIDAIQQTLSTGYSGTHSYFVAATSNGSVATELIFVNGLLVNAIPG